MIQNKPMRDLCYWLDVMFGSVAFVLIAVGIGHFLDWLKLRKAIDGEITLACLSGYGLILLFYPRRFTVLIVSLLAIVAVGAVNALIMQTLAGLPLILACALFAYLLLRWKGKLGIRLWIMLRDQIDYEEFCRRGQQQCGAACAGMLEVGNGTNGHRPVD